MNLTAMRDFFSPVLFLILVVGGGLAIGYLTTPGDWYALLVKPGFNPPGWVFGPAWTFLYILIAIAGWRVSRQGHRNRWPTKLWWTQLALNFLWTPVFFSAHRIGLALGIVLMLLAAIIAFIAMVWSQDRTAAWLFVPYAAWVAFASVLNASIFVLN